MRGLRGKTFSGTTAIPQTSWMKPPERKGFLEEPRRSHGEATEKLALKEIACNLLYSSMELLTSKETKFDDCLLPRRGGRG